MNTPPIVSRQDWDAAREQLLVKEKAVFRARDALAAERRRMPWMAVEKAYEFIGPKGKASLLDLFEGRRQLIVYRAFFEPGVFGWPEHACRGCSLGADQVSNLAHLNARDTTLAYVSRAPQADIARLKARMGWQMPWYTITDSFDADFGVDEWHGHNVFFRDGDRVFRTYFINSRGDEAMGTVWSYLDATPLGRQEVWEDSPEGYPQTPTYKWWNWHDNYEAETTVDPRWVKVSDAGEAAFRNRGRSEAMSRAYSARGAAGLARHDIAAAARGAADWLGLAAAPTFAMMALVTAIGGEPQLLCSAAHLGSHLERNGRDVPPDGRLPFGSVAEAGLARVAESPRPALSFPRKRESEPLAPPTDL